MRLIIQLGVVSNNALKPEISRMVGRGEALSARRFTSIASMVVLALCCVAYAVAVALGPRIVLWWGDGKVVVGHAELAMIGVHALLNVAWFTPAAYLIATNRHTSTAVIYAIASGAALLIWGVLSSSMSPIAGASLLLAVPELAVAIFMYVAMRKIAT
jgi:O-antigen/teichoic acid export membrane protein